jgi:hypothetical protein
MQHLYIFLYFLVALSLFLSSIFFSLLSSRVPYMSAPPISRFFFLFVCPRKTVFLFSSHLFLSLLDLIRTAKRSHENRTRTRCEEVCLFELLLLISTLLLANFGTSCALLRSCASLQRCPTSLALARSAVESFNAAQYVNVFLSKEYTFLFNSSCASFSQPPFSLFSFSKMSVNSSPSF